MNKEIVILGFECVQCGRRGTINPDAIVWDDDLSWRYRCGGIPDSAFIVIDLVTGKVTIRCNADCGA